MLRSRRDILKTALTAAPALALSAPGSAFAELSIDGFRGSIDAHGLGVRGDGHADQSAVLQEAINAAARVGNPLFLPPGTYPARRLTLPSGAHLVGVPGATKLVASGPGPVVMAEDADRLSLIGLSIDGLDWAMPSDSGLISLSNVATLTIEGCQISNAASNGLRLIGVAGRIAENRIERCSEAALFSSDARGLRITGNVIADCLNNGILVWRSSKGEDGTIVSENRIMRIGAARGGSGQWGNGVNIFRAGGVTVAHNTISDCAYSAIRSNAGSACQFLGNSCARLGEVAMYAEFGFEGAVIANNIIETAATGISITNFNEGGRLAVCTGNIVRDLFTRDHYDKRGVGIAVEADTVVSSNVVENAPVAGVVLGWGEYLRDVAATGNVVRQANIGIAVSVAKGAGSAVITDNLISGARTGAILGMAFDEIVTRDLATSEDGRAGNVSVERNRVS